MKEPKSSFDDLKYIGNYDRVADCHKDDEAFGIQDGQIGDIVQPSNAGTFHKHS